jgi:hypothetical protein
MTSVSNRASSKWKNKRKSSTSKESDVHLDEAMVNDRSRWQGLRVETEVLSEYMCSVVTDRRFGIFCLAPEIEKAKAGKADLPKNHLTLEMALLLEVDI